MKPRGAFLFYFGFMTARIAPLLMLVWMFARSRLYGSDARFAFGESALAIPFQLDDNRIYLRVGINGSRPLSFMLDSGASKTVLSVRNARSFGMEMQPLEKVGTGIGAELPDVYLIKDAVSFNLPGFVFSDDGIVAIPLDRTQECLDAAAAGGRSPAVPAQPTKEPASR